MNYDEAVKVGHKMGWKSEFIEDFLDAVGFGQMQERIEELTVLAEGDCCECRVRLEHPDKWECGCFCHRPLKELVDERDAARALVDQLAATLVHLGKVRPVNERTAAYQTAISAYDARGWK
jgi:hypothetical protein